MSLSISYDNYLNSDQYKQNAKLNYGDQLRLQIQERSIAREEERKRKKEEEFLEEIRLKKEQEQIEQRQKLEEMRRKEELEMKKKENERIMNSFVVMTNPKSKVVKETPDVRIEKTKNYLHDLHRQRQREKELFTQMMNSNIEKIKNNVLNQQNEIIRTLNHLRDMNMHGNLYKIDFIKEFKQLKEELKLKKSRENIEKDYLYNSLVLTKTKQNEMNNIIYNGAYLNTSLNIVNLKGNLNLENRWYIDPEDLTQVGKNYNEDKFILNKILTRNAERVIELNKYS